MSNITRRDFQVTDLYNADIGATAPVLALLDKPRCERRVSAPPGSPLPGWAPPARGVVDGLTRFLTHPVDQLYMSGPAGRCGLSAVHFREILPCR
jgi:hypothetical protein